MPAAKSKKPRQRSLPKMQDARDKALESLVEAFLGFRDVWKEARTAMDDQREKIQTKMLALGLEKYSFDGHVIELEKGQIKVTVKKQKGGEE